MTTTPPDLSSLRIRRDDDAQDGASRGRVWAIVVAVLALAGGFLPALRAARRPLALALRAA